LHDSSFYYYITSYASYYFRYEEEIARLRQQLEQARAGHAPMTSSAHSSQHPQPPPPNIGPQSNLFGGIMNASGGSGASASQPGLVAPPQMGEQPQPPHGGHYPPSQPQG
jgi:glucose repression regulatory protein TUP1